MKCQSCNGDISEYGKGADKCVWCDEVTLTISKSDYNFIVSTMTIEHGRKIADRIKAGVVNG